MCLTVEKKEAKQDEMSRDIRFPTMWHFDKCIFKRACAASF